MSAVGPWNELGREMGIHPVCGHWGWSVAPVSVAIPSTAFLSPQPGEGGRIHPGLEGGGIHPSHRRGFSQGDICAY